MSSSKYNGEKLCSIYSTRLKIAFLLMLGIFFVTLMRICFSMVVVCIITETSKLNYTYSTKILISELSLRGKRKSLDWSENDIILLLSATYWGGLFTAIWSGYLSDRFSPKWIIIFGVIICVIVTALTPILAEANFFEFLIARIIMGLGEAFIDPAEVSFRSRWFGPTEMTRMDSFAMTGKALAGAIGFPVSSQLCQMQDVDGWKIVFYVFASFGGLWILIWAFYSSSKPINHKFISKKEEKCIENKLKHLNIDHNPKALKLYKGCVPWKSIFTSLPIYINLICQFTFNFSEALLSAFLPTYLAQVLELNLNDNGWISMTSFFIQLIFQFIFGACNDYNSEKQWISATTCCKIFQVFNNFLCALSYLGLAFMVNKDRVVLVAGCLILNGLGAAASICGFMSSQSNLAPQYAGILSSFLRITAALGAVSAINVVGWINRKGTYEQWRIIWCIAATLNILTAILFLFAGTGEAQEWGKDKKNSQNKETQKDETTTML